MKNTIFSKKSYIKWFVFLIWMVIWYLAAHLVGSDLILPGPHAVLMALLGLLGEGSFYLNVLWTVIRTLLGIVISFCAGVLFGALSHRNGIMREFLRLPVNFFKSIPVMAIIIYVILVVKSDWVAVVVCFLMCFPIAYTNILNGLDAMNDEFIELGRTLGLSGSHMVRFIIRPSLDTPIRTALNLIASMSWKVVVASEVLAIPKYSIGYQMLNSKYYLETADLFAYMIVLIVLSLLMERAVAGLSGMSSRGTGKAVRKAAQKSETLGALPPAPEIRLERVSKSFITEDGKVSPALKDFSAEFREGVTAVLGPSGEGKTTMARLISGLEEADSGEIRTGDSRIAYLFQEDRLLPWLNVRDNMLLSFVSGKAEGQDPEASVKEMAEKLEISDALNMMPGELSGGMAHRAALGRTLLYRGNLLILDEPFRGLDEELRERIIGRLSEYLGEGGTGRTVILITHDEDLADKLSDKRINI